MRPDEEGRALAPAPGEIAERMLKLFDGGTHWGIKDYYCYTRETGSETWCLLGAYIKVTGDETCLYLGERDMHENPVYDSFSGRAVAIMRARHPELGICDRYDLITHVNDFAHTRRSGRFSKR